MCKSILIFILCSLLFIPNGNGQTVDKLKLGDTFPNLNGELLSSKKISLPDHCKGKVSILIVAFKRGTQTQIDTWAKPLLHEFSMMEDFRFIEIPMISNFYSWISSYIDNGMRKGIVPSMHKNVMTYYGPLSDYYKYFDVADKKLCYLFLIDRTGKIQFLEKGEAKEENLQSLIEIIKDLINS
ncbi:hypothetical protein GCQ56_11770 [Marinifilum sp. N1E240]|uniref:hypothetical protein n=1 Tax=Marinifilum sp. N1E240 TaxID=2608082 RepID=UPI00128C33D5|nr:hypothetical protein [Marinifilum sp. N1E240]MPQ47681.1 hypothetical protein [Marinifilum sp. N1E240]